MTTPTLCECPAAGWCERHQCQKTAHWQHLCQTRADYFQLWENGRGPGQPLDPPPLQDDAESIQEPGLLRKAVNFGRAVVRHAVDRNRGVNTAVYESRLAICRECPQCDLSRMVCRVPSCGCQLTTKARWRSESCPQGKWPAVPLPDAETNAEKMEVKSEE